jgi:Fe-S cluster assembly protein SufD
MTGNVMDSVLEFYKKEVEVGQVAVPWVARVQEKAMRELEYRAFPSRKDEDWKYSALALDGFLATRFAQQKGPTLKKPNLTDLPKAPLGQEIILYNGEIIGLEALQASLPAGVIVEPLLSALERHEAKVKPWLGKLLTHEHGFHALNMAALQTGVFIYVPKNIQLDNPLLLTHWQDVPNAALYARHLVVLEEGSRLNLIENYQGKPTCAYFTNAVTEVHLGAHAELVHYKIQAESSAAFHIGHLAVQQGQASSCQSHSLSVGGQLARMDISLTFLAPEASCLLNGLYLPAEGQHMDHHTSIHHLVPDCKSKQDYKGILSGKTKAVFNGKVLVSKGAMHTAAEQQNKNLLLSSDAEIDTKPQLEIFADDVTCSHGATVGQLDEDALFYMATRGLNYEEASLALIQAFAMENIAYLPSEPMQAWMSQLIEQQLSRSISKRKM